MADGQAQPRRGPSLAGLEIIVPPLLLLPLAMLVAPVTECPSDSHFTATPGLFRGPTLGVLRPDEGTVEVRTTITKPLAEFGNDWEFLLKLVPTAQIGLGSNTLFGIFIPPAPETGLAVLLRNQREYCRADVPDFTFQPGRPITIAVTWSDALRVYLDGRLAASTALQQALPESLLPYDFAVETFAPYRTDAVRISTRARSAAELAQSGPLTVDADTALLATDRLSQLRLAQTAWHHASGYHRLVPAWRREKQVFTVGQPAVLPVAGVNHGPSQQPYAVSIAFADIDGAPVEAVEATVALPPDGQQHVYEIALPALPTGWYQLTTTVSNGGQVGEHRSAMAVVPAIAADGRGNLAGYYGQHQDWDADPWPFEAIGVRSTRCWAGGKVFLWSCIEPERGRFEWARADAYVEQCRAAGMDVLGLLGYPSRWAAEEPPAEIQAKHVLATRPERWKPADLAAWGNYVRTTVARYRGRVAFWEIYNEVNFCPPGPPATFSGSTQDYLALLQVAYREAKAADPDCQVLISGFSADVNHEMPLELIELGGLDFCDIFNVHGYSGSKAVEDWVKLARAKRPGIALWQTEQMWHQMEPSPQRRFLTVASLIDFLAAGYQRFYHMGSTEVFFSRYTGSPTPDFQTVATFQDQLRPCDALEAVERFPGDDAFALRHRFRRADGRYLTIVGSELGEHRLSFDGSLVEAQDEVGRPVAAERDGQRQALTVARLVYLVSDRPLTGWTAQLTSAQPLCTNGGFEQTEGDIGMGGLQAGRPRQWLWRDTTYDPGGKVLLDRDAASGQYSLAVTSTGGGRVYGFQYTKTFAAGRYTLRASIKRQAGDATLKPYAFVYDIEHERIESHVFEQVGEQYGDVAWTVDLPATDKLAIGLGINGGAGRIVIDDVSFEPAGATAP